MRWRAWRCQGNRDRIGRCLTFITLLSIWHKISITGSKTPDIILSAESLGTLTIADEEEPSGSENLKDQISSTKDEKITSPRVPSNATATDPPEETTIQLGSFDAGYENSRAMWDEYPQFLNSEGMELGSHVRCPSSHIPYWLRVQSSDAFWTIFSCHYTFAFGVRVDYESYNNPDFKTEYDDARFFIIKSYSEDNVHKSIKYGVWASTPNGNKKLDGAYSEAKGKGAECPVFLLFSRTFLWGGGDGWAVNFEKSVDYWQQDKWSGHFPVKWHVVKDVPNSLFRHIILENNDNKPVTNSRDTQEVKLEQGLEMLNIFKNHEARMSILDDFDFYEERQKAMQERKAHQRQQQQQQQQQVDSSPAQFPAMSVGGGRYNPGTAAGSGDYVSQSFAKTFAQAVRLDEKKDESAATTVAGEGVPAAAVAAECFPNMGLAAPVKGGG
ncbi:unnamed protein product [Spirodela intermedia]|uniref:YTH domain-containing family protein n=1 Tax=Spirodela intermedia TaxID=51605 RepID=A0A7I8JIM5_SPIIN|nr:unnamed protein product [Spirodela intermedia]CAA6670007.1 unnamed protein product [Spirodela intermedia]